MNRINPFAILFMIIIFINKDTALKSIESNKLPEKQTANYDEYQAGKDEYNKTRKIALTYLKEKGIFIEKAIEVDTIKKTWVKDTYSNDTINSFSREWGYLEAFDDIKQNNLLLVMMGPPPDMTYWNLIYKYNIGVKLNVYERADSGALGYHEIMWAYIENKYGRGFFKNISNLRDSLNDLNNELREDFIKNYNPFKIDTLSN